MWVYHAHSALLPYTMFGVAYNISCVHVHAYLCATDLCNALSCALYCMIWQPSVPQAGVMDDIFIPKDSCTCALPHLGGMV